MIKSKSLFKKFRPMLALFMSVGFIYLSTGFSSCNFNTKEEPVEIWDSLTVTASAYNSLGYQTGPGDPNVTAWGDTIEPGMKIIAVSRDLIDRGLDHNTPVKIEGFEGIFLVKDKMHYRWKNKIDIYMGEDVQKARKWGRKKVKIAYQIIPADTLKEITN
jgi:3D (Asp-Asp-Asp) domain-containing protein